MASPNSTPDTAALSLLDMILGHWVSQAIRAAAELRIADALKDGPKHVADVAREVSAHPRALYRLLCALASKGIFQEAEEQENRGLFSLTPLAELLRSDLDRSLRDVAIYECGLEPAHAHVKIMHALRTGKDAFTDTWGCSLFEFLRFHPGQSRAFDLAMASSSKFEAPAILHSYDFSTASTVMDVGGGTGTLLKVILEGNSNLKGILVDLPHVIEGAGAVLQPVKDRCEIVSGSFFDPLPKSADVIILKSVLHEWGPAQQARILSQCHVALPDGSGRLLVVEAVIPGGNEQHFGKWMDVHMMVCAPGGMEHTAEEYEELLRAGGFRVERIFPVKGAYLSIIEAIKEPKPAPSRQMD